MNTFLATIYSNPPLINLCGFVEVNRGLITSVSITKTATFTDTENLVEQYYMASIYHEFLFM